MASSASPYISHCAAAHHTSQTTKHRGHSHAVILYGLKNCWNYSQSSRVWCVSFHVVFRIQENNLFKWIRPQDLQMKQCLFGKQGAECCMTNAHRLWCRNKHQLACVSAICCYQHHVRKVQCWWTFYNLMDTQIREWYKTDITLCFFFL